VYNVYSSIFSIIPLKVHSKKRKHMLLETTCLKTNINVQLSERSMKWDLRFGVEDGGGGRHEGSVTASTALRTVGRR